MNYPATLKAPWRPRNLQGAKRFIAISERNVASDSDFYFCAMSVQPRAGRMAETCAEARVPYAKIMGCAKFGAVRTASRSGISFNAVR